MSLSRLMKTKTITNRATLPTYLLPILFVCDIILFNLALFEYLFLNFLFLTLFSAVTSFFSGRVSFTECVDNEMSTLRQYLLFINDYTFCLLLTFFHYISVSTVCCFFLLIPEIVRYTYLIINGNVSQIVLALIVFC